MKDRETPLDAHLAEIFAFQARAAQLRGLAAGNDYQALELQELADRQRQLAAMADAEAARIEAEWAG
jgi:hypothetical protein